MNNQTDDHNQTDKVVPLRENPDESPDETTFIPTTTKKGKRKSQTKTPTKKKGATTYAFMHLINHFIYVLMKIDKRSQTIYK